MKKKVVAMLILAMLATGCGANGSDDTGVTLETSEEAQGTGEGQQTGTVADGAIDETSSNDEDDNTVDVAAGGASDGAADAAGTDASSKDLGAEDDAASDKSSDATDKSSSAATDKASDTAASDATDKASDTAASDATDKASSDASKGDTKKDDASKSKDSSEKSTSEDKKETSGISNLPDGSYNADFVAAPTEYSSHYIKSITVSGDEVILEATIYQYDSNWNTIEIGMGTYVLKINSETKFLSGGGEQDPIYMSKDEFAAYIANMIGSGLGLNFKIKNGYLAEIGIWS